MPSGPCMSSGPSMPSGQSGARGDRARPRLSMPSAQPAARSGIVAAMAESSRTRPLRVGHKGAALLAPGNTPAAFRAALQAGVDMIEFDVLSERRDGSGRLLLAHDYEAIRDGSPLTLEQGLAHLAGEEFAGVQLDVDVKIPGYGPRVVAALREAGLIERSLVSSMFPEDLDVMRALEPALRVGWSVPRVRRDYTTDMLTAIPALAILTGYRALLPRRVRAALRAGRFDAIMAHWRLITPRLVRAVADGGGELYVWTVDDAAQIARLSAMGVDGIITNDPHLFG
jgi:glycerophosphoryl diester phosphodiesterase